MPRGRFLAPSAPNTVPKARDPRDHRNPGDRTTHRAADDLRDARSAGIPAGAEPSLQVAHGNPLVRAFRPEANT